MMIYLLISVAALFSFTAVPSLSHTDLLFASQSQD